MLIWSSLLSRPAGCTPECTRVDMALLYEHLPNGGFSL